MARFVSNSRGQTKVKLGTTVLEKTQLAFTDLKSRSGGEFRTLGEAIDYVAGALLDMTPAAATRLLKACMDERHRSEQALARKHIDSTEGFSYDAEKKTVDCYLRLEGLLNRYADSSMLRGLINPRRRVELADGASVVFPDVDDWIEVNPSEAGASSIVYVVEIKNGKKYSAPHFVYYSRADAEPVDRAVMINEIAGIWPEIRKVQDEEIAPVYDKTGFMVNYREMLDAPMIGVFEIGDAASFAPGDAVPYGAMVYRQ